MGVIKGTSTFIGVIPFTELFERLLNLGRIDSPNNADYAKGIINDSYTRTLPRVEDWTMIIEDGNIQTVASYNTGTIAVTIGSTSVTGTSTVWTSAMTAEEGYKIKFSGNRDVYKFEYVSATSGTITPSLSGPNDLTGQNYVLFKDEYALASDHDRFLKNGSVYVKSDGRLQDTIKEVPNDLFQEDFSASALDPIHRVIQSRVNATTGQKMLRVNPPPKTVYNYPYEYIKKFSPMSEYSTGTVAVTNANTAVTGTDTLWLTNVSAGDYFRVDANGIAESSIWYKIASVTTDTALVLESAYGEATESLMDYTGSVSPIVFPSEFHEFILYDGLLIVGGEQGDPNSLGFTTRREEILSDLKKNYKSRRTNVQYRVGDDGIRSGRSDREDDTSYRR
jgi:hypothetical protein